MSLAREEVPGFDDATSISSESEIPIAEQQMNASQSSSSPAQQPRVEKVAAKLVMVGQGAVGKSCFLIRVAHNEFPQDYVPTVFDNTDQPVSIRSNRHQVDVQLGLFDTMSRSDDHRIRRLVYPGADLVVICFSVIHSSSFEEATTAFVAEANENAPGAPVVLLGLKSDLRKSTDIAEKMKKYNIRPVPRSDAEAAAQKLGIPYFETSSLTDPEGVHAIMQQLADIIVDRRLKKPGKPKGGNGLLSLLKRLIGRQE